MRNLKYVKAAPPKGASAAGVKGKLASSASTKPAKTQGTTRIGPVTRPSSMK